MTLTDEQLIEALKARGHDEAAAAVAAGAGEQAERSPEQGLHQSIRSTLTGAPKQAHYQAVADLFGYGERNHPDDNQEDDE